MKWDPDWLTWVGSGAFENFTVGNNICNSLADLPTGIFVDFDRNSVCSEGGGNMFGRGLADWALNGA